MGINIASWRQRIGCFSQPIKSICHIQTLIIKHVSVAARMLLFLLLVVHGVEANPGPDCDRGRGKGSGRGSGKGPGNRGRARDYFRAKSNSVDNSVLHLHMV